MSHESLELQTFHLRIAIVLPKISCGTVTSMIQQRLEQLEPVFKLQNSTSILIEVGESFLSLIA